MLNNKRKKILAATALGIINASLWSLFYFQGVFGGWQLSLQDKIYATENKASGEIVLVTIDNNSIADSQLGRWQNWQRAYFAKAIENLNTAGAATIGVDLIFSESSTTADDAILATTLQNTPNIVLAAKHNPTENLLPLKKFRETAKFGFVDIFADQTDGIARRAPLNFGNAATGFGIEIVKNFLGIGELSRNNFPNQFVISNQKIRSPRSLEKIYEPIVLPRENDSFLINFFGPPDSFTRISFTDVFRGNFNAELVRDKIVLIGIADATGIHDEQLTPVSAGTAMAGVEIHANIIQTILSNETLRNLSLPAGVMILSLTLLFLSLLFFILPLWAMFAILTISLTAELLAALICFENGVLLPFGYFLSGTFFSFLTILAYRYFGEKSKLRYLRSAFSRYLSPDLVKQIQNDPKALGLGGEKRELTIFFSDIKNFTNISERLSPTRVVKLLNSELGSITKIILAEKGTLDKYIGDAVMAFWNAPLKNPDHAFLACRAALNSQKNLPSKSPPIRIGIHTGEAIVGNLGLATHFNYTAIGDAVNLASRLEGVNKIYSTKILISGETYKKIKGQFLARLIDRVVVKGRRNFTEIYELLAEKKSASAQQIKLVEKSATAFEAYRKKDFSKAARLYRKIKHPASTIMLEKIATWCKNPPAKNWRGETILKNK